MLNLPYFPFYPADFMSDERVQVMSMEGKGVYIHLLSVEWREGSIPADRSAIVLLCKGQDGPHIDEAILCFRKHPRKPGRLYNHRLDIERRKLDEYKKSKQIAGLHGADKRWHNHPPIIGLPLAKNDSTQSSSYTPSNEDKSIGVEFDSFWGAYPIKFGKQDALKAFKILRRTILLEDIAKAFNGYMDFLKSKRIKENFEQKPMYAATFLRSERWREYLDFKYRAPL